MKTASGGRVSRGLEVLRWRSCTPGHVLLAGRGLQCRDHPPPPPCCLSSLLMARGTARPLDGARKHGVCVTPAEKNIIFFSPWAKGETVANSQYMAVTVPQSLGAFHGSPRPPIRQRDFSFSQCLPAGTLRRGAAVRLGSKPRLGLLHQKCSLLRADNMFS